MHSESFGTLLLTKRMSSVFTRATGWDRSYELDHFLPWKFVAHNQLWNLIPVDPQANSSKSDYLPSEIYIDRLAETQRAALSIARDSFSHNKWKKEVEPYITDLLYYSRRYAGL